MKEKEKEKILRDEFVKDFFDSMVWDMMSKSQKQAIYRAMDRYAEIILKKQNFEPCNMN